MYRKRAKGMYVMLNVHKKKAFLMHVTIGRNA